VTLNLDAVGHETAPIAKSWRRKDAMLYAVGVGAGSLHAQDELEFTTENSYGVDQLVLPTFSTIIGQSVLDMSILGDIDFSKLVHGDQRIFLNGPIPPSGTANVRTKVEGIYDKGSGALIILDSRANDVDTGGLLMTTRIGLFVKGGGDFGGVRAPDSDAESSLASSPYPSSSSIAMITYETRPDQALLYRLSGDRNPLHSDPRFAKRAGFDRPILHGLCSYGFTGRALLHSVCASDPRTFRSMQARFSRPTYPGDTLTVSVWDSSSELRDSFRFQTCNQRGEIVIDGGLLLTAGAIPT
jgi:acyl dehydratase